MGTPRPMKAGYPIQPRSALGAGSVVVVVLAGAVVAIGMVVPLVVLAVPELIAGVLVELVVVCA
jgi:hypothetical protein